MLIKYSEYQGMGYTTVGEDEFPRYEAMAAAVKHHTQNRVTHRALHPYKTPVGSKEREVAEHNIRGICEIIDLYYIAQNPSSDAAKDAQIITGFTNGQYSETYLGNRSTETSSIPYHLSMQNILAMYFTADQTWRGF